MTPKAEQSTKKRPPITEEGKQAAASIAAVRQSINSGATAADARRMVRGIEATKPPVITPETLSSQPTPTLTPPATATQAPALQADLAVQAEDAFTKQQEQKAEMASTAKTSALDDYLKAIRETQGETGLTSQLYGQAGGVDDITLELNDINDQIRKEQRALELAKRSITEKGGGLASGAAAEIGNLERVSLQKQADLSIIQMGIQGRYDSAKTIADRAVAAQLEKQKILNEALRVNYEDKKAEWTTAEQREFETLLGNRERAYEEKQQQLRDIKDFALSALQAGAPVSSVQRAMGAKTLDEAMSLVGSYLQPKQAAASTKAPDLQNFGTSDNPVWKQWNPATGAWEDVSGLGGTVPTTEAGKTLNQINFLQNTIKDAQALVGATGPNAITRGLGNVFVGNTRVKQLQNKIDTLKTNLLTLNADPALKKFFGPQMTEKDTQLLMSAGSTLDAYNNSVTDNEAELKRYSDLLNKISKSIPTNEPVTFGIAPTIITAPDGLQIEIID